MSGVFVIAEVGVNHNGKVEIARELIDVAKSAGVDAVKFQAFTTSKLVAESAPMAQYQEKNTQKGQTQYEMLKALELSPQDFEFIYHYCRDQGLEFLCTPFDLGNIDMLESLGVKRFKIPSGEINNLPYLRYLSRKAESVVLSTGMAVLGEIEDAIEILTTSGMERDKITVLHATTEYPTPMNEVNLRAMQTISNSFKVAVGYSDHTLGSEVAIAAVALGATVIEKHFTLSRTMEGPDHRASLEPDELRGMVQAIRNIEVALGDGVKKPTSSEGKNKLVARKSIVASEEIPKGRIFTEENITIKRPGTGLSPMRWDELIGTTATKDYKPDDLI
ncbi:MAG: N-acetylneuraminate synthase [Halioglobus sp.]